MRIKFLIFFIFSMFAFYSCAQNETQKQPENANEGTEFEEDTYYFSTTPEKIGSIENNSKRIINVKVYSYELGNVQDAYDKIYEIDVNPTEKVDLIYYDTYGFTSGSTFCIEINDWKGAGWFCDDYVNTKCTHNVDGIWYKSNNSYSDYVRDENTGELIPFALDEIQFTVNEDDSIQIKVIPVNE